MKRVTEPELMIAPEQVKAYTEADFSLTEEDMVDELFKILKNSEFLGKEPLVLDLGCGPGNISERIAIRWDKAKVIGIDDSPEMLRVANDRKRLLNQNSCFKRLRYIKMNISALANSKSSLLDCADVVVSNSLLHHLHDPSIFFSALFNVSKNGAIHFHRDLRRPSTFEDILDIQKRNLVNAPSVLVHDFIASLSAAHTLKEMKSYVNFAGIDTFVINQKYDRYI